MKKTDIYLSLGSARSINGILDTGAFARRWIILIGTGLYSTVILTRGETICGSICKFQ